MIPEKNNIKTREKNVEKNGKPKANKPVTSAEEEEEERIKTKKAALKRTESVNAAARNAVTISPRAHLPLRQRQLPVLKTRRQNSNAQSRTRVQLPPVPLQQPSPSPKRRRFCSNGRVHSNNRYLDCTA